MTQADLQSRIIALDLGERRTGVAVSDVLGIAAHARPAIHHQSRAALIESVRLLVEQEEASEVVVGLPLALSGDETSQTATTRDFIAQLAAVVSVPVSSWDERLSSVQAARATQTSTRRKGREAEAAAARRKSGELDSAAAAHILQTVLENRRGFSL